MNLPAFMNNGRWLILCPQCSTALPAWNTGVICPRCHPQILAKALQPIKGGLFRAVGDPQLIGEAQAEARQLDEEYFPEYPPERAQIEQILRLRPLRQNMNWEPGESLEDLRAQNLEHGDPVPEDE
jgi:hypothetical protein